MYFSLNYYFAIASLCNTTLRFHSLLPVIGNLRIVSGYQFMSQKNLPSVRTRHRNVQSGSYFYQANPGPEYKRWDVDVDPAGMLNISDPSHFAQCHISFKQNTSSVPLICEKLKRKRSLNPLYPFRVCFVQIISKESDMNVTPRAAPRVILVFHSPLVSALFYFCCNFRSLNFTHIQNQHQPDRLQKLATSPVFCWVLYFYKTSCHNIEITLKWNYSPS